MAIALLAVACSGADADALLAEGCAHVLRDRWEQALPPLSEAAEHDPRAARLHSYVWRSMPGGTVGDVVSEYDAAARRDPERAARLQAAKEHSDALRADAQRLCRRGWSEEQPLRQ